MNKKYFMLVVSCFLALLLTNLGSAGVGFKEYSKVIDLQNITTIYGYIQHGSSYSVTTSTLCFFAYCYPITIDNSDFVPRGEPFQFYVQYGLQPIADWNLENPDNTIDYCRMLIRETHNINVTTYTLNATFDITDISVTKDQYRYFVNLYRGDYAEVLFTCHYTGNVTLKTPASFTLVAPTRNCLACQYFKNFKASIDNILGDAIGGYSLQIFNNLRLFLTWNIQIWITLFWVLQIIVLMTIMGAVFLGFYWVYLFARSLAKK
jgi:hypothetical protein